MAEVSEKPWGGGEVTICNLEALRREDPVEVKVWQWLVRSVTHTVCKHVYVCGQDSEQQKAQFRLCPQTTTIIRSHSNIRVQKGDLSK